MKIRKGFVSNSSSASFVIHNKSISQFQIELIKNHIENGLIIGMYNYEDRKGYYEQEWIQKHYPTEEDKKKACLESYKKDAWSITEDGYGIRGYTSMDNFDMYEYLKKIGIDDKDIDWSGEE